MILKITEKLKLFYPHFEDRNFKKTFLNALPFWLSAFITGVVSVLYAKLFLWAELGTIYVFIRASWISSLTFLLSWWLVSKFSPYARGSGIPQVNAAIELSNPKHNCKVHRLLDFKVILIKVLSSLTKVFGGGVIGRKFPTIQISSLVSRHSFYEYLKDQ